MKVRERKTAALSAEKDKVDVLVIGAGASGGALVWSLAEAGFDVMCLEQGGWVESSQYPTAEEDWEIHRQTDFNPDPNYRSLAEDYPVNNTESPIAPLMYNAVGGSTIHWSAHFPRLHPSDFKVRTLDGIADDWPVSYTRLEPFFDLNDRMMGVAGLAGDPAYPDKPKREFPPVPLGVLGDTLASGFDKLGWHWWPCDSAILTQPHGGRKACNNCGPCEIGCRLGAKASIDITYWPKALRKGAKLTTHARVREITVGRDGLADGVVYYDSEGVLQRQRAEVVVVACNGVGTPRLLLNSTSRLFPNGLANSSGLIGKNLMFHPVAVVTGVFEEALDGHRGPLGCAILSHEFYETDTSRGFIRGYQMQIVRSSGPVNTALGGIPGCRIPWGENHHRLFGERFAKTATLVVMGEDLPEEHNRVTLDWELTDGDGVPAPKVSYTMSDNSERMLKHGIARAKECLETAGAVEVIVNPLLRPSGWHLMGTSRMGIAPGNSVVDPSGRCHDVKNLYIVDGSIFVTCGAVNPTSTIQALALLIADGIKRNAGDI